MDDIELRVFDDLTGGDRDRVEDFAAVTGLPGLAILGLEAKGAFLMASDTDARGRTAALLPFEPIEPVGETVALRIAATVSKDGFVLVEADKGAFEEGDGGGFAGTTEALRAIPTEVGAGFDEAEDIAGRDVAAGAEVVGFFNGGAVARPVAVVLEVVGLTEPVPNVPELIIWIIVGQWS